MDKYYGSVAASFFYRLALILVSTGNVQPLTVGFQSIGENPVSGNSGDSGSDFQELG